MATYAQEPYADPQDGCGYHEAGLALVAVLFEQLDALTQHVVALADRVAAVERACALRPER